MLHPTVLIVPDTDSGDTWQGAVEFAAMIPARTIVVWPPGGGAAAAETDSPCQHIEISGATAGERLERALNATFEGCPVLALVAGAACLPPETGAELLCSLFLYDAAFAPLRKGNGIALALRLPPPGIGTLLGSGEHIDPASVRTFLTEAGLTSTALDAA